MFKALTTVEISLEPFNIDPDTVVVVTPIEELGIFIGSYAGATFEISPDEYVKLTHASTNTIH